MILFFDVDNEREKILIKNNIPREQNTKLDNF